MNSRSFDRLARLLGGATSPALTLGNPVVRDHDTSPTRTVKTLGGTTLTPTGATRIRRNSTAGETFGGGGITVDGGALTIGPSAEIAVPMSRASDGAE